MRSITNERYHEEKAKIAQMRNDVITEWNAYMAENLEVELLSNKFQDWQKADVMKKMHKCVASRKECIDLLFQALDLIEGDLDTCPRHG